MTQDGDLTQRTRTAIKVAICLLLAEQVLGNAYKFYLHNKLSPLPIDPRVEATAYSLFVPVFIYLMMTKVPDVLKKSAGIKRQAIHIADWWLVFGIWQFAAGVRRGPLIALFAIGAVIMVLSIKDAIHIAA